MEYREEGRNGAIVGCRRAAMRIPARRVKAPRLGCPAWAVLCGPPLTAALAAPADHFARQLHRHGTANTRQLGATRPLTPTPGSLARIGP